MNNCIKYQAIMLYIFSMNVANLLSISILMSMNHFSLELPGYVTTWFSLRTLSFILLVCSFLQIGCTQGRVLIWLVAHTHQLATIRKSCCTGTRHYQSSLNWGSSTSSINQSQETRTDSQNLLQYRFFHRFEREKKDGCIRVEEGDGDDCREKVENWWG